MNENEFIISELEAIRLHKEKINEAFMKELAPQVYEWTTKQILKQIKEESKLKNNHIGD